MKRATKLAFALALVCGIGYANAADKAAKKDIVDTAVAAEFNTLVTAVKEAGLVEALKGTGPFTVFAPTDEAFAKLPEGTLESLLKDKDKLKAVLLYHVVSGKVTADQVVNIDSAKTLQGGSVHVSTCGGGVKINDSNVIKTDVMTSNGVIHVIDTVLIPENL